MFWPDVKKLISLGLARHTRIRSVDVFCGGCSLYQAILNSSDSLKEMYRLPAIFVVLNQPLLRYLINVDMSNSISAANSLRLLSGPTIVSGFSVNSWMTDKTPLLTLLGSLNWLEPAFKTSAKKVLNSSTFFHFKSMSGFSFVVGVLHGPIIG